MEIDSTDRIRPKYKACFFLIFPAGIGLRQVLLISASKSDSYHMFKAPAAPDPIATASKDIKEELRSTLFGAINKPTIHVNKTKDITLGFIKLKRESKYKLVTLKFFVFVPACINLFYLR